MAIKTEKDLQAASRESWARMRGALESKTFGYVLQLGPPILKANPEFLEGRQCMRVAAIHQFGALSMFSRQGAGVQALALARKACGMIKTSPAEAIVVAEEALALDPFNRYANNAQADAALALDMPEIAALAYETMRQARPQDKPLLHQLAHTYMRMGDGRRAVQVYDAILAIDPHDGTAVSGSKNATALTASSEWPAAIPDGAQHRPKHGKASMDDDIATLSEQLQREPNNLDHPRRIADIYLKQGNLDIALEWYTHTYELGGKTDASLEKVLADLRLRQLDKEIAASEIVAHEQPDRDDLRTKLDELRTRRAEWTLTAARERVRKYPTDGHYRYELGSALYHTGLYKDALIELQKSLKQPGLRIPTLNLMGLAYAKYEMDDLAESTFLTAIGEIPEMDESKKEVIYNLAMFYKASGEWDKMIALLKKIFETDMEYKDVASLVEEDYRRRKAAKLSGQHKAVAVSPVLP